MLLNQTEIDQELNVLDQKLNVLDQDLHVRHGPGERPGLQKGGSQVSSDAELHSVGFSIFHTIGRLDGTVVENHRDVLEDIVDLSAVDYTRRHTTPSPEVSLVKILRCSCK